MMVVSLSFIIDFNRAAASTMLATSSMSIFLYDFQCFLDFNRVAASMLVTSS
jgi:hypothetical protein